MTDHGIDARLISKHLFEQADFMPNRNRVLAERRAAWIARQSSFPMSVFP